MNLIKAVFIAALILLTTTLGNCTEDTVKIAVETPNIHAAMKFTPAFNSKSMIINRSLTEFRRKCPQFDYGVNSMNALYDAIENPKELYEEMNDHSFSRSILFCCELLTGGACEVVKCLSVFHPELPEYGEALIGLYAAKSIFWGINAWLNKSARQSSIGVINALQVDHKQFSQLSTLMSQVDNVNLTPIIKIANAVVGLVKIKDLSNSDKDKLARLKLLSKKIGKVNSFKKVFMIGGKVLSFLTGVATGITVAITGQNSTPSYYLTLGAGGLDSIVDSAITTITKKPIIQKYITVSEIIYLSNYFLDSFNEIAYI